VGANRGLQGTGTLRARLEAEIYEETVVALNDRSNKRDFRVGLYLGWLGAAVLAVIAAAGFVRGKEGLISHQTDRLKQQAEAGRLVLVTPVISKPEKRRVQFPGQIRGYFETPIYPNIAGYVRQMMVDKGARVRKGQLIAFVDSPPTDQQVRQAKAQYELAKVTDRRMQELVEKGVIPQQQADQSHSDLLSTYSAWRALVATQRYEYVYAPYDGIITARNLDPGALVANVTAQSTSPQSLYEMATLKPLRVYVYLPQNLATLVKNGDSAVVTVNEFPDREFAGTITRHPEALAESTRTMLIEVDLPNSDQALYPGMYAQVAITLFGNNGAPEVPDQALIFSDRKVFVPIVRDNRLHLAEVTLGLDDGIDCEIKRGIKGGELVALGLGQTAREGEPVRTLMAKTNPE
jgi:RND family efflux transporter MFP subunit